MNDLITVIVTIYNREKFLKQCLESLQKQTYKNFEAIMVDDGSTDNSIEIAKSFTTDKRFQLITCEHIGFSAVKNIGLDKAKGKYIIFLDSDDFVYPYWLEFLYTTAVQTGADISTCFYDEFFEGKTKSLPEPTYEECLARPFFVAEYSFLKMNLIFHRLCSCYLWNKLIKKEIYDTIRFKDQIALSDIAEIYKIVDKANKVAQVQMPLIHYRRHLESTGGECGKRGIPYFIFRMDIIEAEIRFVWEKYPQSRFAAQSALLGECHRIVRWIGKDAFMKNIDRPFFREVLSAKPRKYVFVDEPPRKGQK